MRGLLLAAGLGILTSVVIAAANQLPYSVLRDTITDALSVPGGAIASVVYPEGVHSGHGAPSWGLVAAGCNVAVYIAFWFAVVRIVGLVRRMGKGNIKQ